MLRVLGIFVSVVGSLVLVAFFAAYLGYYIPPETIWSLQVLALALPILTLALIPLALFSFLTRNTVLGIVQVLALVLFGLRHLAPWPSSKNDATNSGHELGVLTFNTKAGNTYGSDDQTLLSLLEETDPDVACLQEFLVIPGRQVINTPGGHDGVFSSLGYRTATGVSRSHLETRRPILARYPIVQEEILPLWHGANSYAVRAVFDSPGGRFAVYNLHLRGFTADRPWRGGSILSPREWIDFFQKSRGSYLARAKEARALKRHLISEAHPFLVCGDLNTTSNQWDYRHISRGLQDSFEAAGEGWGKTYHARLPIVRIDYVLASESWTVSSARVLGRLESDHRPVLANLRLN